MFKQLTFHHKLMSFLLVHFLLMTYSITTQFNITFLIVALIISKLFNSLGNEAGLHRLWCHKAYTTKRWKEFILHCFSTPLLYGSSITYAGIHRAHHAYADTENDPHITRPWWKVVFYIRRKNFQIPNKFINDLLKDPWHKWTHKNYFKINLIILLLFLICLGPVLTGWFLSFMVIYNFIAAACVNVLGHRPEYGYKNWPTNDQSSDNTFLKWYTWNEGYHNFHHYKPGEYYFAVKKGQFDFPGILIKKFFIIK